ncbi:MAG: hypothetical protein R3D34_11855 [Nitratireductor sp.]
MISITSTDNRLQAAIGFSERSSAFQGLLSSAEKNGWAAVTVQYGSSGHHKVAGSSYGEAGIWTIEIDLDYVTYSRNRDSSIGEKIPIEAVIVHELAHASFETRAQLLKNF